MCLVHIPHSTVCVAASRCTACELLLQCISRILTVRIML